MMVGYELVIGNVQKSLNATADNCFIIFYSSAGQLDSNALIWCPCVANLVRYNILLCHCTYQVYTYLYYLHIHVYVYDIICCYTHIYIYRVRKYLHILYIYTQYHCFEVGPILREEVGRPSGRFFFFFFRGMNQETCHDWESWRGFQTWATLDLGC